jgi:hypothetical protein
MDYKILTDSTTAGLEAKVNENIARGWVPRGGVSASAYFAHWTNERKGYEESEERAEYAQAMTSTKESREAAARVRDY